MNTQIIAPGILELGVFFWSPVHRRFAFSPTGLLGEGCAAKVYEGKDLKCGKAVAVKIYKDTGRILGKGSTDGNIDKIWLIYIILQYIHICMRIASLLGVVISFAPFLLETNVVVKFDI